MLLVYQSPPSGTTSNVPPAARQRPDGRGNATEPSKSTPSLNNHPDGATPQSSTRPPSAKKPL
jgi:hypothetical protein